MNDRNNIFAAAIVTLAMLVTSVTSFMAYLESKEITKWEVQPKDVMNEVQELRQMIEQLFSNNPELQRPEE